MRTAFFAAAIMLAQFSSVQGGKILVARRKSSLLINPDPQPDLPTARVAAAAADDIGVDLDDVQGDVLIGMKKKKELFLFFSILEPAEFKTKLANDIHPLLTTTTELLSVNTQPITAVNIAFSFKGLLALGFNETMADIGDSSFKSGQLPHAADLGDLVSDWVPAFTAGVHGLVMFASDNVENVEAQAGAFTSLMGASINEDHRLLGVARPGQLEGTEHFGYMDGISQPTLFASTALPGQRVLEPNVLLFEGTGAQPAWTAGGSVLAFRQLKQLVPEFDKFTNENPLVVEDLTPAEGSALLGARMVGRWKSGAPVDLAPLRDDPALGADPSRNNDFSYEHTGFDFASDQTHCPFSAHTRKTLPRNDLDAPSTAIMRAGIPYGPEVTDEEATNKVSSSSESLERGLAFVSYQSSLAAGFEFIQESWANNANFIFNKNDSTPGVDPIVGVNTQNPTRERVVSGLDPTDAGRDITLVDDFIVARGGEYFFTPSLSAIINVLAV